MASAGSGTSTSKPDVSSLPPETVEFAHRLPPNLTNEKGNTLLMLAAYAGHIELTKGLLDRGGDPNRINDLGQSMIAGAVFKAHNDIVHALMTKGADPRLGTPNAIQTAHMFGRKDLMEVLGARDEDLKDVPAPFPVPGS